MCTFNKHFHVGARPLDRSNLTIIVAGRSRFDNYSMTSLKNGLLVDQLELFRETYARSGQFISQAAADAHVSLNLILS